MPSAMAYSHPSLCLFPDYIPYPYLRLNAQLPSGQTRDLNFAQYTLC
jgi:hypothetical protein